MTERVLVAMSGGVDSSVAAALLLADGFEVVGVTLQLWDDDADLPADSCGGQAAVDSARAVAAKLGIEHELVDGSTGFTEQVLRPAWEDYAGGLTPNPCLVCNRVIKFASLCRRADELGVRWIATGHHARLDRGPTDDAPVRLRRGHDRNKDQSYFLALLAPDQLARVRFPVGRLTKAEVRTRARDLGLPSAERAESQDACFTGGRGGFAEALRVHFDAPEDPGVFVDPDGNRLGDHHGIHHFTIGQRKGLNIALGHRAYVSAIRADTREVVVTDLADDLLATGLVARDLRWAGSPPTESFECRAQIRYRSPAVPARVEVTPDATARVAFESPQRAVTPGQAVVLYEGDYVLGAGWITFPAR